jgi:LCP family protein required for cell wall assembly
MLMKLFGNKRKTRRENRLTATKVIVSLSFLLILIAGGIVLFHIVIRPPEIPRDDDGVAFHTPEFNPDDALINIDRRAPEGVTIDDRKKDFYTFIIVGLDQGINTDTIMVASYDAASKEANIISIPRDSLVNVSRRVKKINAAYPAGTLNGGGQEGGIAQLKREVKTVIGFMPDFYIVVNLKAFVEIINAVGGVEVEVRHNMVYSDPTQNLHINISKGTKRLNGSDALKFARYRHGAPGYRTISDYERIENQQAVIKALLTEVIKPANLLRIPELIKIFADNVFTDLSLTEITWFATQLNGVRNTDGLSTYTMPTTGTSGLPMYYEFLDGPAILELVNATINPYTVTIKPEDVDIISSVP